MFIEGSPRNLAE